MVEKDAARTRLSSKTVSTREKVVRIVLKEAVSSAERDAMIAPLVAHNTA